MRASTRRASRTSSSTRRSSTSAARATRWRTSSGEVKPPVRFKERPEDFVVEELPAYEPSGEGAHVFVRFTKTGLTTLDAVRAVARALGCDPREAGFAGMKDKQAVASQTVSLQAPRGATSPDLAARALALRL